MLNASSLSFNYLGKTMMQNSLMLTLRWTTIANLYTGAVDHMGMFERESFKQNDVERDRESERDESQKSYFQTLQRWLIKPFP